MKNCHSSEKLDALVGKCVEILFTDGKKEIGVLLYPNFGDGYKLRTFMDYDVRFYKSHVKNIKEAHLE